MKKRWAEQTTHMTTTLRRALCAAVDKGQADYKNLERLTGVKEQSLMRFAGGKQCLRLASAEKLANYFGYRFDLEPAPSMDGHGVFGYVSSHFLENRHLRAIFDEKYLQHALYEALWHRYGDFLEYECHYDGIPTTNEIDLAIPWQLAMEVKWLKEHAPHRSRDNHPEKLAQKIANLCRLAFIRVDQSLEQTAAQCWLVFGGRRDAFIDFYSWYASPKQRKKAIADRFFPYDPMNRITEIDLKQQIQEVAVTSNEVFKELAKAVGRLALPERIRIRSHGTASLWNDDYDHCFVGWELAGVSDETFVIAS